jgi:PPOX class probable F420-dependent enzyme
MERGNLNQLPGWASDLLGSARVARLGLLDGEDHPRVLPVTFVVHDGAIWSAIDRKPKVRPDREPARVRWLRRNPRAAFTVDRYEEDWRRLAWVQVLGDVSVLAAAGEAAALTALAAKYPGYAADPPPGPLLRLEPRRALWWSARGG